MPEKDDHRPPVPRPGWKTLAPEKSPDATFWPAALALGSVLLLWGLVSSLILTAAGLAVMAVSIAAWLGELRHE